MKQAVFVAIITFLIGVLGSFAVYPLINPQKTIYVPQPYPIMEYRTITQTKYVDRWHEPQVVTVNNTVEKEIPVEVEKVKVVNGQWREFQSLAEFASWANDKLVFILPNGSDPKTADCDDYVERMQILAYKDGYLLSGQLVDEDGYVFGKRVTDDGGAHDMLRVNIGNEIYLAEPQPSKWRIIKVGNRD